MSPRASTKRGRRSRQKRRAWGIRLLTAAGDDNDAASGVVTYRAVAGTGEAGKSKEPLAAAVAVDAQGACWVKTRQERARADTTRVDKPQRTTKVCRHDALEHTTAA